MKPASRALLDLLQTRQFYQADIYTFWFPRSEVNNFSASVSAAWCSGDRDITYLGTRYASGGQTGPYFATTGNRFKLHSKIGLEVDTFDFDVVPGDATIFGDPFLQACHDGTFDGATVTIERAFMPTYGNVAAGLLNLFAGRVGEVTVGRQLATFQVNSWVEQFNAQFPRNLFQASCLNQFGDNMCTVNVSGDASTVLSAAIVAGSTASSLLTNSVASVSPVGRYDLGSVYFTSGALSGLSRTVRSCVHGTPTTIVPLAPFPSAPTAGDTFDLFGGCDKSFGTNGCAKWSNTAKFRGCRFIPVPAVAV